MTGNFYQDPDAGKEFVLRLKPLCGHGWPVPALLRFRRALKRLSRYYGLICVTYKLEQPTNPKETQNEHANSSQKPGAPE